MFLSHANVKDAFSREKVCVKTNNLDKLNNFLKKNSFRVCSVEDYPKLDPDSGYHYVNYTRRGSNNILYYSIDNEPKTYRQKFTVYNPDDDGRKIDFRNKDDLKWLNEQKVVIFEIDPVKPPVKIQMTISVGISSIIVKSQILIRFSKL